MFKSQVLKLIGQTFQIECMQLAYSCELCFGQTFAIFCGLGVHNCQLHEKVDKLTARHKVTCEVLAYHATASAQETTSLAVG